MDEMKQKRDELARELTGEIQTHKELRDEADRLAAAPIAFPHPSMTPDNVVRRLEERCEQIILGFKAQQKEPGDIVKVRFAVLSWLWRDRCAKAAGFEEMETLLKETLEENKNLRAENENMRQGRSPGGLIVP